MSDVRAIAFSCPACGRALRAPLKAAGATGKCTGCQTKIRVPTGDAVNAASRTAATTGIAAGAPSPRRESVGQPQRDDRPVVGSPAGRGGASVSASDGDLAVAIEAAVAEGTRQAAQRARRLTVADVEAAVTAKLPRNRVSSAYRMHLFLVAAAMAVLPLVYLATVVGAAAGVFYYTAAIAPDLLAETPRNRGAIIYFLLVATPVVAGGIMVLFLIKPLFFRIQDTGRRRSLTRQGEPLLFALVDRICDATGAPRPTRIDVDYQVNASAQPEGGVFSVASGKMVLTIGVPLLAGLTARQLSGVLAHEFGHFSQKVGMGATLLIRKINFWFTRVVYQRDRMDEWLDKTIAESDMRIGLILLLAKGCVFITRGVLWCFMMVGHAISAALLRQMEYDADRYEIGLVGSKTFAETSQEMRRLAIAQSLALDTMFQFFTAGRLADDLVVLTQDTRGAMPREVLQKIREMADNEKAGWLDTHPTDAQRIAHAAAAAIPGVFNLDRPARELVTHYAALCKNVTWDFYRDQLGTHRSSKQLEPTADLLAAQAS